MENINGIKYIDLFAGVGGFRYGIEKVGATLQRTERSDLRSIGDQPNSQVDRQLEQPENSFECVYSNEWDKYANSVYRRHYGECDIRDIRTVKPSELPDFDLICGGFPCQSFSVAGKRGGFNDTRGTLFFEIARLAAEKQPRLLLLENVKGLLNHDQGRTFRTILATLDELGYDAQWKVLNSKNFGVPQNRERVILIGHLRGTPRTQVFPIIGTNPKTLKELTSNQSQGNRVYDPRGISTTLASQAGGLGSKTGLYAVKVDYENGKREIGLDDVDVANTITATSYKGVNAANRNVVMEKQVRDIVGKTRPNEEIGITFHENGDIRPHRLDRAKSGISELAVNYVENVSNTISASHEPKIYTKEDLRIRRLTPIECERLQGFEDNWTQFGADGELISDTQRYKMMGNAVTTNVIQAVMEKLL